jgi:NTP pyrophosphatase (non-canonical NTP hydrolase)
MIYDELLTFEEAQQEVMAHKRRMGFNTTDIELEFGLLLEELGELHNAWRKWKSPRPRRFARLLIRMRIWRRPPALAYRMEARDEIADVLIFMLSLTDMLGIQAGEAVAAKMRLNAQRTYATLPNGTQVKQ